MTYSDLDIWLVIVFAALGTFVIRFSFLGLVGNRPLPEWFERHLKYTVAAVFPAMVAPILAWSEQGGGQPDSVELLAAAATLYASYKARHMFAGLVCGGLTLAVLRMLGF